MKLSAKSLSLNAFRAIIRALDTHTPAHLLVDQTELSHRLDLSLSFAMFSLSLLSLSLQTSDTCGCWEFLLSFFFSMRCTSTVVFSSSRSLAKLLKPIYYIEMLIYANDRGFLLFFLPLGRHSMCVYACLHMYVYICICVCIYIYIYVR